jgi:hypothetical protein
MVTRPTLLRPLRFFSFTRRDFSGRFFVISLKSATVPARRPALVGL